MINKQYNSSKYGFTALIAVILLASGIMAISLSSTASVIAYSDSINLREYRIQANLNADSCLEVSKIIVSKNYFVNGTSTIQSLNCEIYFQNSFSGNVHVNVIANFFCIKIMRSVFLGVDEDGHIYEI